MLYDQVINGDGRCLVTYIDYKAAFDSVSHKFLDYTLNSAKASRKSRAIFRAIYKVAAGVAKVAKRHKRENYLFQSLRHRPWSRAR